MLIGTIKIQPPLRGIIRRGPMRGLGSRAGPRRRLLGCDATPRRRLPSGHGPQTGRGSESPGGGCPSPRRDPQGGRACGGLPRGAGAGAGAGAGGWPLLRVGLRLAAGSGPGMGPGGKLELEGSGRERERLGEPRRGAAVRPSGGGSRVRYRTRRTRRTRRPLEAAAARRWRADAATAGNGAAGHGRTAAGCADQPRRRDGPAESRLGPASVGNGLRPTGRPGVLDWPGEPAAVEQSSNCGLRVQYACRCCHESVPAAALPRRATCHTADTGLRGHGRDAQARAGGLPRGDGGGVRRGRRRGRRRRSWCGSRPGVDSDGLGWRLRARAAPGRGPGDALALKGPAGTAGPECLLSQGDAGRRRQAAGRTSPFRVQPCPSQSP